MKNQTITTEEIGTGIKIQIIFDEKEIIYINTLRSQAGKKGFVRIEGHLVAITQLLESRKIYVGMFGYQWKDEIDILSILIRKINILIS